MSMNKDQVRGRIAATKGKIKEEAGDLVGNDKLKARGQSQKSRGKAQAKQGDAKQGSKDTKKRA
jgi:uncharacterized protein YjbJ (UPF0337 family)